MHIELRNIEFKYGNHDTISDTSETEASGRRITSTSILRARIAVFRCSVDELKGPEGYEPIIEITVPYSGDFSNAGKLAKAALLELAKAIDSADMDFSVLV